MSIKGTGHQKMKIQSLSPHLPAGQVKYGSPQNIVGASQPNSVALFSSITEVAGDLFSNVKKHETAPYCHNQV